MSEEKGHECDEDCVCCCGEYVREHSGWSHNHGPMCERVYYESLPDDEDRKPKL